jgi:hypothetical protein
MSRLGKPLWDDPTRPLPEIIPDVFNYSLKSVGEFTANGATPVSVANAQVGADSVILFGLKTVGGTVGAIPTVKTLTAGTGFTVAATASDTSIYRYVVLEVGSGL